MATPKKRRIRRKAPSSPKISRKDISAYQRLLGKQADKGAKFIDDAIAAYLNRHPRASVAQVRKFTFELMQDALPTFTDLAETLSCEFMEEIADRHGWDGLRPEIVGTTSYGMVNERLHYLAKNLAEGNADKYRDAVMDATRFFIMRSAQDAMVENCCRANIRYARVPTGFETCAFCFMLASRGFVYRRELKAGLGHAYHPNCSCVIVPGAEGLTKIDGYDPKGMGERWDACLQTIGGMKRLKSEWKELPDEERAKWLKKHNGRESAAREAWCANRVMREVETRDWRWLYTGEVPGITFETAQLKELKMRRYPHEIDTAKALSPFGVTCNFIEDEKPEVDKSGKRTGRITSFADFGSGFELKTTREASSYNTINGYLKSASKKHNIKCVVFDNRNNENMTDAQLVEWLQISRTFRRGRVYIIDYDGNYRFIR